MKYKVPKSSKGKHAIHYLKYLSAQAKNQPVWPWSMTTIVLPECNLTIHQSLFYVRNQVVPKSFLIICIYQSGRYSCHEQYPLTSTGITYIATAYKTGLGHIKQSTRVNPTGRSPQFWTTIFNKVTCHPVILPAAGEILHDFTCIATVGCATFTGGTDKACCESIVCMPA